MIPTKAASGTSAAMPRLRCPHPTAGSAYLGALGCRTAVTGHAYPHVLRRHVCNSTQVITMLSRCLASAACRAGAGAAPGRGPVCLAHAGRGAAHVKLCGTVQLPSGCRCPAIARQSLRKASPGHACGREDAPHSLSSCRSFGLAALQAVLELEQALAHRVGEGHPGAVQEGDLAHPPPQQRSGHSAAQRACQAHSGQPLSQPL